jgi:hypothetical protein
MVALLVGTFNPIYGNQDRQTRFVPVWVP